MTKKPHLLYVAWGFPPCRGGGVYRALATANGFIRDGFDVTVLTADRETFIRHTGIDASLESRVDPAVNVVRVPFEWPAMDHDMRNWTFNRGWNLASWRERRLKREMRDFPEPRYGIWAKPLIKAAARIHRDKPVDLVVATANPNVDFAPADHLHRTAGVPYVMDYRDAWTLDVFGGGELNAEEPRVGELEGRLLASAREIWFVNEPIRQWHQDKYPVAADRMHVVANGYDPEFAPKPRLEPRAAAEPVRFGYIGTVSSLVPIAELAAGWEIARERGGDMAGAKAEIWGYLGYFANSSSEFASTLGDASETGLSYEGPLPKDRVREVYEQFDALLLILGAGLYVTSGKVFEYTASALPIVSVHDPRNAASDVLRDYPLWFPIPDLEPESLAAALEAAAHAAHNADEATRAACADFAQRYARDVQLSPRIEALGLSLLATEGASS